jgi:3-oxoacyl-[acyl-carrier-protein] synthase-3
MSTAIHTPQTIKAGILRLLKQVQPALKDGASRNGKEELLFAEILDSMAMVEFIAVLAEACGVSTEKIEESVNRQFTTVDDLSAALHSAGLVPNGTPGRNIHMRRPRQSSGAALQRIPGISETREPSESIEAGTIWVAGTTVCLPDSVEAAGAIDARLGRQKGWLEKRAGIRERRVWGNQDPLAAAASAGRECIKRTGARLADVGALLVTSESPPLLAGLAAAIHHRLKLRQNAVALEIGGACTGYLASLWLAQSLMARAGVVLVIAVEAASKYLQIQPGEAGEGAALFGDGLAVSAVFGEPACTDSACVTDIFLSGDGSVGDILQVNRTHAGDVQIRMKRIELAGRAIEAMASGVQEMTARHQLKVTDLAAVVAHGGNGRMPALLARQLGLSAERIWSETPRTGNLGSASIPVAWASRSLDRPGPVVWTAAGAGLTWGAAMVAPNRAV